MRAPASPLTCTSRVRLTSRWSLLTLLVALVGLLASSGCNKKTPNQDEGSSEDAQPSLDELDLWAGLEPPEAAPGDVAQVLAPKPGPARPKTVGEVIEVPFPPPAPPTSDAGQSSPVPEGPLEVLRYGPEGDQGLVDAFRVTFDRPMVPLASIDALRDLPVPLTIEPEVPGEFRWMGTRTVAFYPEGRLPFSTTYTASIPEGTAGVDGSGMRRSVSWKVTTPELALQNVTPRDDATNIDLEPTLVLTFNQPVDRAALGGALRLRGGGGQVAIELPAPSSWASEEGLEYLAQRPEHEQARTVVARPTKRLRPDTRYVIELPRGTYGEGPNGSDPIEASFSTYPPLNLSYQGCGTGPCSASRGIFITSTTSIRDPLIEERVSVEPAVEGLRISGGWRGISLQGKFRGDETYAVHVDAGLEDEHGQALAREFDARVRLGPLDPDLRVHPLAKRPGVVEAMARHTLGVRAAGLDTIEVSAYGFGLDEVPKVLGKGHWARDHGWPDSLPGATFTDSLDVAESRVEVAELELDLDRMRGSDPFVYVVARSNELGRTDYRYRRGFSQTIAVTDLGVSGVFDADDGAVLVTGLHDGAPVSGASVRLVDSGGTERWSGTTDASGLAYPSYGTSFGRGGFVLVSAGEQAGFLHLDGSDLRGRWVGSVVGRDEDDRERVFFFNDRQPVKPGETMHVAGILRREQAGPAGGVTSWASDFTAKYTVTSPRGVEVATGELKVGRFGTFAVDVPVPEDGDTGNYSFEFTVPRLFSSDLRFWHSVPVETYRTPEFKVEVSRDEDAPLRFGDDLRAVIGGAYYQGSPLVGAEVTWTLDRATTDFRPAGDHNQSFTFGQGANHGYRYGPGRYGEWGGGWGGGSQRVDHGDGALDARGELVVSRAVPEDDPAEGAEPPPQGVPQDEARRPTRAATYTLSAVVTDESRQAIAARGSWVVHPSLAYVGLRAKKSVLREGEQGTVEAVAVDTDGARLEGKTVEVEVIRKETTRKPVQKDGRWIFDYETREIEVATCKLTTSTSPQACDFDVDTAGTHEVRATVRDDDGRQNESVVRVYVTGKDAVVWDDERERIDIVADKAEYAPGDTARLLMRSPFPEGRGLAIVEREGLAKTVPFEISGGAYTLELPVSETMAGGVSVSAMVVRGRVEVPGAPAGQDLGMPKVAVGDLDLDVVTDHQKIDVEVTPASESIAPGGKLSVTLKTTDHRGGAVPAAVAVMVVDEGVLSLMGFQTPDPLAYFWRRRSTDTAMYSLIDKVLPRSAGDRPEDAPKEGDVMELGKDKESGFGYGSGGLGLQGGAPGGGARAKREMKPSPRPAAPAMAEAMPMEEEKADGAFADEVSEGAANLDPNQAMAQQVSMRTFFATTAFFDGEVVTDASGTATLEIDMPENLTTFRIMAVAVDQDEADRFGSGEAQVKVRKPIMLRPSLPRFANLGDDFEGTVMVDNQTDAPQQILVGVRGANVKLTGETEKKVTVPAGESKEVRFDMAPDRVGKMRLQFAALSNAGRDATEVTVPVNLPATRQAFADYGMTEDGVMQTIDVPEDALIAFGGLELSFSSTALNGLEDAVSYLVDYPYECVEQTASRILPIFALGPVLDDFPIASVVDEASRQRLGADGIERILDHQASDGGFGYWNGRESWPYVSTWATLALLEGKKQGFEVKQDALDRAMRYLENYVRNGHRTRWGVYYDWTTRSFALWLMSREGKGAELFDGVWAHRQKVPLYAKAMLMGAAHRYGKTGARDEMLALMREKAIDDARTVHFIERTSEADAEGLALLMHSSVQTDAIVLLNLLEVAPDDPLAPKVMAGIMSGRDPRQGGRWETTHANAWALMAASTYYRTVEKDTPDFTAQVWLDADYAGEHAFKGRSMAKRNQRIPMVDLRAKDYERLTVAKKGTGKLYYRLGLRYAPADLKMKAVDRGFEVFRRYEAIPEPGESDEETAARVVHGDDGNWRVKAGTNVKVTINVVNRSRATFVVVDDAMPAGFEGQNPRFVTSVAAQSSGGRDWGRGGDWGWDEAPWRGHWWFPWWSWDHTQMKDDRMLLFADRLPAGVYTYSYTARATSIGDFVLPPVHAEGMYEPERFGHSSSARVQVVE